MCYVNNKKYDEVPKSFANGCIHMCPSDILSHSKGKAINEQKLFIPADFFCSSDFCFRSDSSKTDL